MEKKNNNTNFLKIGGIVKKEISEKIEGRKCKICGTVLSTYNKTDICWHHSNAIYFSHPNHVERQYTNSKRVIPKMPAY